MMDRFMFHVLSAMEAKLCLVVLARNVKSASYQLLLEEKMVQNAGKQFGSNFLYVLLLSTNKQNLVELSRHSKICSMIIVVYHCCNNCIFSKVNF